MSVLDKYISYYPSTKEPEKGISVNLLTLLQSQKHKEVITSLRSESDPLIQMKLKEKLPCYTVAGLFSYRAASFPIEYSGLAAVDLDSAEDYDSLALLHELKKIPFIAYAGLSCRGKRLFCIIPFLYPGKYLLHYERLIKSFEDIGLPMGDTCHKSISQARYVSYNTPETCFFNHNARPYYLLQNEKIKKKISASSIHNPNTSIPDNPFGWCEQQFLKSNSFSPGNRHNFILGLVRYCNLKGISVSDTLKGCISNYVVDGFDDTEITKIVKHIYSTQSDSHNSSPFKPSKVKGSIIVQKPTQNKISSSLPDEALTPNPLFSSTPVTLMPCTVPEPPIRNVFDSAGTLYTQRPYPEICD